MTTDDVDLAQLLQRRNTMCAVLTQRIGALELERAELMAVVDQLRTDAAVSTTADPVGQDVVTDG